ncbi:MAG TPA: response regulator, partial [Candidatus Obscuribacterales bacterium]
MSSEPKVNVLLVDDYPENLLALEAILENLGQNLVRASSGEEALRCLLDQDFAVILLDVQMPGIDGFETATLIRERSRSQHTPIIFMTAFSSSDSLVFKGYSLGAVDYLLKPVKPEILTSKVAVFV